MKKRMIWTYGTIIQPLDIGKRAYYLRKGIVCVTEAVQKILEQTEEHILFETERCCYCIQYQCAEEVAMALAA